eukprot:Skav235075  [mRNA]  locus=scaffold3466:172371:175992:- [translate_table: standard]
MPRPTGCFGSDRRVASCSSAASLVPTAAMFRLLCAVALTGATSDSVLDNALAWMKQNGAEAGYGTCLPPIVTCEVVLDTTQHCIAAAKNAAVLHSKCGQAFQEKTYDSMKQFCGQPDCVNNLQGMENEYGTCYGGTVCASLSSTFDYSKCKAAMEEYLPAAMHSQEGSGHGSGVDPSRLPWELPSRQENSACAMDGEFYCAQQTASILMKDAKCFAQFKMPATGSESCAPECVDLWKKERAEHPACMKIFAGQIKDSWYILTLKLTKQLILANINEEARKAADSIGTNVTTFADVCINNGQKLMVV